MKQHWIAAALLAVTSTAFAQDHPKVVAQDRRTVVAKSSIQPQVAIDAEGAIYVVSITSGNIEVAVSTDRGKSIARRSTAIDAAGRARGGRQRGPRIGIDDAGHVHVTAPVCFDAAELMKRYPAGELWYTVSRDGARTWSERVRINEVPRKAAEALHWLAVDAAGYAHVAWLDAREGLAAAIYYARIHEGRVGPNRKLLTPACECCAPGLAVSRDGQPWLTYREGGDQGQRGTFVMSSADGGDSWSSPSQLNQGPSNVFT